jgi:uncharacterized protein YjbI with pentapeptide repeats
LEDELGYFHDVMPAPEEEGAAEVRWWSPEPQGLQSEEEDREKNQYLVNLLTGGLETRRIQLANAELLNAELLNAELLNAELPNAELPNAELPNAELPNAVLPNVELPNAKNYPTSNITERQILQNG